MLDRTRDEAIKVIMAEEGFEKLPYRCSEKKWTIGFGTRLPLTEDEMHDFFIPKDFEKKGITKDHGEALLERRLRNLWFTLKHCVPEELKLNLETMPKPVQIALSSLVYQLGPSGILSFKRMFAALAARDWKLAASELLDSKMAREQTPARAKRMAKLIRSAGK